MEATPVQEIKDTAEAQATSEKNDGQPAAGTALSKNAQKKKLKKEQWEKKKEAIKQHQKEKRKLKKQQYREAKEKGEDVPDLIGHKSANCFAHLTRFNHLTQKHLKAVGGDLEKLLAMADTIEPMDAEELKKQDDAVVGHDGRVFVPKLTKHEKLQMFKLQCSQGPKVIIDCEFDHLMTEKEKKSLSQQLAYVQNNNKRHAQPMNIIMSGIDRKTSIIWECLKKSNCENWAVNFLEDTPEQQKKREEGEAGAGDGGDAAEKSEEPVNTYMNFIERPEVSLPKEELIYLTADSPNEINWLDPSKAYIIGGIVDRNRYINLTYKKAQEQGIGHAKLPIGKFMKLSTSAVLTVNHVFEILAEQFNFQKSESLSAEKECSWKETLDKVIPKRKVEAEDEEMPTMVLGDAPSKDEDAAEEQQQDGEEE